MYVRSHSNINMVYALVDFRTTSGYVHTRRRTVDCTSAFYCNAAAAFKLPADGIKVVDLKSCNRIKAV